MYLFFKKYLQLPVACVHLVPFIYTSLDDSEDQNAALVIVHDKWFNHSFSTSQLKMLVTI